MNKNNYFNFIKKINESNLNISNNNINQNKDNSQITLINNNLNISIKDDNYFNIEETKDNYNNIRFKNIYFRKIKFFDICEKYINKKTDNSLILHNTFCIYNTKKQEELKINLKLLEKLIKKENEYLCILTNEQILLKRYNKKDNIFDDDSPNFDEKINIDEISTIVIHDYSTRIIFDFKDGNRKDTLLFDSTDECNLFAKLIIKFHRNIKIYSSDKLEKIILLKIEKIEETKINKKEVLTKNIKSNISKNIKQFINKTIGNILSKIQTVTFETTIETNIYPKNFERQHISQYCFYFKDINKVFYFTDKFMYVFDENLEQILNSNFTFFDKKVYYTGPEDSDIYKLVNQIPYGAIKNCYVNWNDLNVNLLIKDTNQKFDLNFNEKYDMFMFNLCLTKINKVAYKKFMKTQEYLYTEGDIVPTKDEDNNDNINKLNNTVFK